MITTAYNTILDYFKLKQEIVAYEPHEHLLYEMSDGTMTAIQYLEKCKI